MVPDIDSSPFDSSQQTTEGELYAGNAQSSSCLTGEPVAYLLCSSYAAAYASLGWLYWREWLSWSQDSHDLEQASFQMQKAIALDTSCLHAPLLLANVYLMQKQYAQAITEAEQAIALDPTCTRCYTALATILIFAGQPQEATLVEKAVLRYRTSFTERRHGTKRRSFRTD